MPSFGMTPQRAKVLLIHEDGQTWGTGWALIQGSWLLWLDEEFDRWHSWPLQHIRCVEWQHPVVGDE